MANKHKGEVSFEVAGVNYTMRFSANALCELEDALDMGINAVATQLGNPASLRLKTVRAVFWAGLRDHHPDMTTVQAGDLVTELGIPRAIELVGKAFELTFQDAPKVRPLKPGQPGPATTDQPAGTGLHS